MRKKLFQLSSRREINQSAHQSGLTSPVSQAAQLNNQNENTIIQTINRKFSEFMIKQKKKKFTQKFKQQRGRNNAVKYEQKFNFKQQWEFRDKSIYTLHYNYFFPENFPFRLLNLIILFLDIFLIWILSIFRLFQYENNSWIFSYSLSISLLDSLLKTFFILRFLYDEKIKNQHKKIQNKTYILAYVGNLFCVIYSILGLTSIISNGKREDFLVLDIACILFVYLRCEEIYQNFKIAMICSKYKAYMKIFDLMSNLFTLTHLFGILIFAVSRFQPNQTYLSYAQLKGPLTFFQRYIYSIYFSSTTMLTVGYGDLLPANIQQIAVVLIMQLFGIVMIGYINGQVGDVLCTLRKQRQNLQNDLTNTQKLEKSFKLNNQTSQKIREYLINNRKIDQQLNIENQNNLLQKISDQLRIQANYNNHINIIKQSLFFVYNFSKKTQIEVSSKLNKIVFAPNQSLTQIMGKQKIYLLSKGQIALYVSKNKKNKSGKKILKVLSKNAENQFHQNSYGYTALILGRPTELKAFSKDFAVCHTLQRHDFIDVLNLDQNDLETFHEMRAKYEVNKHPEKQQASEFYSIKEHYSPNPLFVIKKYLKDNHHTKRKQWIRCREKCRTRHQPITIDELQDQIIVNEVQSSDSSSSEQSIVAVQNIEKQQCLNQKERQNKYKNLSLGTLANLNIRARGYTQKYCNKKYQEIKQKREELVAKCRNLEFEQPFQISKQYQNFFKHSNASNMIKKFAYQNNVIQFVSSFIQFLPTFKDNNLADEELQAKLFRHKRMLKSLPF